METQDKQWSLLSSLLKCATMRTLYIWGPAGIGKTFSAYRVGMGNRSLYAVTLTEETPAAELRGHFIPKGSEFIWHDGPIVRAMRDGARIVINEVSHAGSDVLSMLYAVLESPDTARLTLPTGETVIPAPGFQCILTDNCEPTELPVPLVDRFDSVIMLSHPSPEAIERMPENIQSLVLTCASVDQEERRLSLRAWEKLDRLMSGGLSLEDAGQAVMGNAFNGILDALRIAYAKPEEKAETVDAE